MALPFLFHMLGLLSLSLAPLLFSSPSQPSVLQPGSVLLVENQDDFLISPNGLFTAGFYKVGENAYCFSIWYTKPLLDGSYTAVWMANRDVPVNGKRSKLSLLKTGNLILTDAYQPLPVWTAGIIDSTKSAQLMLNNTGNLFLQNQDNQTIWQSFDSPTNTLLPLQSFTKDTTLISSRSSTNYSQGFYKFFFDNDNVLRLVYNGPYIAGTYWPDPQLNAWVSGRSTWAPRRTAVIDPFGHFVSSDRLFFNTSDAEDVLVRRLTMDVDGNLRAYSLDEIKGVWKVTWQAISDACRVHGICGENSTCSISPTHGRKCSCLPNHRMINQTDWSYGCEPVYTSLCGNDADNYVAFPKYDFYGYDARFVPNTTFDECKKLCASICDCKGFLYKFDTKGFYSCYAKFKLVNGFGTVINGTMYLKVPKSVSLQTNNNMSIKELNLKCGEKPTILLHRAYVQYPKNVSLKFMKIFTYVFGVLEIVCIIYFFYKTRNPLTARRQGYLETARGFQRFSYAELKKASDNFSKELGRGGDGIVYKGILSDKRVAAIKVLKKFDSNQGEAELLAEIHTLGRINHMNLIAIWGYCVEKKHRMLVYEYMENGSLAQNLRSDKLDWVKRLDIAIGTAKGLVYLHEECLEWVLHCDVKPHNILLDINFSPKVADFGLSKLLDRDVTHNSEFTKARGTRGYMAPEWLFLNQPITSKVDVYSYGVVMLEMITGKIRADDQNLGSKGRLASWVTEKMMAADGKNGWIEDVVDSTVKGKYDTSKMEGLIKVALRCLEEDKDARPTMRQVVDMLLHEAADDDNEYVEHGLELAI